MIFHLHFGLLIYAYKNKNRLIQSLPMTLLFIIIQLCFTIATSYDKLVKTWMPDAPYNTLKTTTALYLFALNITSQKALFLMQT